MRTVRYLPLLALLVFLAPGHAADQGPGRPLFTSDPMQTVHNWYLQFYDRDGVPAEWAVWANQLRSGKEPPEVVLARLLGSGEYFNRAGSTPEGFVRALFLDLTGREPPRQEFAEWVRQVGPNNREQVALAFLKQNAQAWQPPAEAGQRDYVDSIRDQARTLADEVERFQQDVTLTLRGEKERELYDNADEVLQYLRQFRRSLRGGATREQVYRDFDKMDRRLHELIDAGRERIREQPVLQRDLARVEAADNQLHYALSQGDTTPERGRDVIRRRAADLYSDAQDFQRTADYALSSNRAAGQIRDAARAFVDSADHFRKDVERGAERDHMRREFGEVERAWGAVAEGLNRLSPYEGNSYLRSRALQLDSEIDALHRLLEMEGNRPRILMQLDRPK
jgi:hypothetical protein